MLFLLKLEEFAQFLTSILLFSFTDYTWWLFPVCLLLPDIGMFGFAINPKIEAFTYNLFHHKGLALLILFIGYYFDAELLFFLGLLLFGHAALDRMFGYGLKFNDSFQHTHLGKIGI